jgi:bisanhydrobacterioruberin hydratase
MIHFRKMEKLLWIMFLAWSSMGLISIVAQVDAEMIDCLGLAETPRLFLLSCLSWGDFIFHALAAANLLIAMAPYLGWPKTWSCFACIGVLSALVETMGARTGFPFGSYFYTERMGPMVADTLPLAIPLAWWNILGSFYWLVRYVQPRFSPRITCLAVASAATALDWVMEPFAWQIRGYWIWENAGIPLQNYFGWFGLSFILCRVSPLHGLYRPAWDKRVAAIPCLMLAFFVMARMIHGV